MGLLHPGAQAAGSADTSYGQSTETGNGWYTTLRRRLHPQVVRGLRGECGGQTACPATTRTRWPSLA